MLNHYIHTTTDTSGADWIMEPNEGTPENLEDFAKACFLLRQKLSCFEIESEVLVLPNI